MSKFHKLAASFARDEGGASLVEYSVLIGLITALAVVTIQSVGGKVGTAWTTLDGVMP